jgi:hypothetical protein
MIKRNSWHYDQGWRNKELRRFKPYNARLKDLLPRIERLERLNEQNRILSEDSKTQNLGFDLRKETSNKIRSRTVKDNLIDHIKKQTIILESKLSTTGPVSTHCAITEFLMSILDETNLITPFQYELQMVENDD